MASTVIYKGSTLTTVNNQTRTLLTSGKYMEDDVTIIDVSSGACEDIIQDPDGFLILDPDCLPNGTLTQDQDGFLVFSTYDICGQRVEYEEGTIVPSEDSQNLTITFSNAHTSAPIYATIADITQSAFSNSSYVVCGTQNWDEMFDGPIGSQYGHTVRKYTSDQGTVTTSTSNITTAVNLNSYISNEFYKPNGTSSGSYWRAGRTYKWIAVWKPTT